MKCAVVSTLISLAFVSQAFAVLRIEAAEGLQSRSRLCCYLMAADPGRIDFSADVRCTSVYDESSRRVARARFRSFRNSLVDL